VVPSGSDQFRSEDVGHRKVLDCRINKKTNFLGGGHDSPPPPSSLCPPLWFGGGGVSMMWRSVKYVLRAAGPDAAARDGIGI